MINPNKFTTKAPEAIASAQVIASDHTQQQIDALHLFFALIKQEGGVVLSVLNKLSVQVNFLEAEIDAEIKKIRFEIHFFAFVFFLFEREQVEQIFPLHRKVLSDPPVRLKEMI